MLEYNVYEVKCDTFGATVPATSWLDLPTQKTILKKCNSHVAGCNTFGAGVPATYR